MDAIILSAMALASFILLGYIFAWNHSIIKLGICAIFLLTIVVTCETELSVLVKPSESVGFARLSEIGPAFILAGSIGIGFVYAWLHKPIHVIVCALLAICSLVLGW